MELYIPAKNFASQYPEWGKWQMSDFKALPATTQLKQAGALLFVEGKVNDLQALKDRAGFTAGVTDGKEFGVTVWLPLDGTKVPQFECGCPEGHNEKTCVHALALMAALVYLFHEQNFIPLSPLLDNVNNLARQIDRSKKSRRQKTLKRLRLRNLDHGTPYLEGDSELPDPLVQLINPYRELSRMARNTLEFPEQDLVKRVHDLIDYVRDCRIRLEAECPDGRFLPIKPELATTGARLRFIAVPEKDLVLYETVIEESEQEEVIAQLGTSIQILEPGRIAQIDNNKFNAVPTVLAWMERGFSSFNRRGKSLPLKTINDFICRLGDSERRLLRQCDFAVLEDGEIVMQERDSLPKEALEVALHISSNQQTGIGYDAIFKANAAGQFFSASGIFGDFMRRLCEHAEESDRLLGSRARVAALLRAAGELPRIRKQNDRRSYIQEVMGWSEFTKRDQIKAAERFLKELERDYCRPKSAYAPLCLEDSKSRTLRWHLVEIPLPGMLALTVRLYQSGHFQELLGMDLDLLPVQLRGETLHEITSTCEEFGIELRIDDAHTITREVSVQVDCFDTRKEDWFELKPSIRCGELTIPPEQWEALLHGQILLEGQDGQRIAPKLENPQMLGHLIEATRSRRGIKGSVRLQRLHLLDWVALRKEGLELKLPDEVDRLLSSLQDFEGIPELPTPEGLKAEMRPYQQRGYEWIVFLHQHRLGACLADDMGLGKTLQAIAFLQHLKNSSPPKIPLRAIAVLPPSLLFNWENEVARFAPDLKVSCYAGNERDPTIFESADLTLTTYDILRRDIETFPEAPFEVALFDEAQALKNHASRRSAAARKLSSRFTLCLTGTPMENHIGEYHAIMDLALPDLMGERKIFLKQIKEGDETPLRRARPFLLRRSKSAILKELPPKVESDIPLAMSDSQREIYTRIVAEVREDVRAAYQDQSQAQAGIIALAALMKLRQVCVSPALLGHEPSTASPKIEYLVGTLEELREEGHSVLVFSQFVKALDAIEHQLKRSGHQPLRLDGSTPTRKRKKSVENFQNSEAPEVFLISLKAGGVGLNLTRASYVIHVDPWWNPSVENQASDRAHRIGQEQTVFIQRLIMQDSVEEKIMALKMRKKRLFDAIVNEANTGSQGSPGLKKEDFDFLLET